MRTTKRMHMVAVMTEGLESSVDTYCEAKEKKGYSPLLACKLENENRYDGGIYARKCQIIRKGLKNNPKRHL